MDADAIVIGAGAAGLAAARRLAERSLRVIVLEARDRVGGRVVSAPSPRAGVPAELGAEFIHGRAEQTMALLREAGSAAIDTGGESWACCEDGTLQPDENDMLAAAGILDGARTLPGDESVERFLQRFADDEARRKTVAGARAFVEGFEVADPMLASARSIAEEWSSGVDSSSARPLGGYRPMFERLEGACAAEGVQQRLSTVVRRISWRPGFVAVETRNAGGDVQTVRARAAIVTLPVGVLRHGGDDSEIAFDPELPAAKRAALQHLEMGHAVRVALWFQTPFWEYSASGRYGGGAFFRCAGRPFGAYWTQLPVRSELLVAWAGGAKATALAGLTQAELIERALHSVGELFAERTRAHEEFVGGVAHDWSRDPFSRGAYSYVAVGGGAARAGLAAPLDDTLFFAGEATSNDGQGGTVNGALETGQRAAREAAAALGVTA